MAKIEIKKEPIKAQTQKMKRGVIVWKERYILQWQ